MEKEDKEHYLHFYLLTPCPFQIKKRLFLGGKQPLVDTFVV